VPGTHSLRRLPGCLPVPPVDDPVVVGGFLVEGGAVHPALVASAASEPADWRAREKGAAATPVSWDPAEKLLEARDLWLAGHWQRRGLLLVEGFKLRPLGDVGGHLVGHCMCVFWRCGRISQ
jgi:hypothetical protein